MENQEKPPVKVQVKARTKAEVDPAAPRLELAERRALLLERAKDAPPSPGVYLMKSTEGQILYVGKAKHLKNRVTSYFQGDVHDIPRIEILVAKVDHFDLILTETEAEALILEWTLIRKHKPKFNIRLKDDKSYPYLKLSLDSPFARIEWTRRVARDNARYFGPFPSAFAARTVLRLLNETFQLRDCSDNTFRHRSRPCILYQIGRCSAPCVGKISEGDYQDSVKSALSVLEGKGREVMKGLKQGMKDAAEAEEYELAAMYRDQIQAIKVVTETQAAAEAGSTRTRDVVGIARGEAADAGAGVGNAEAQGTILRIRNGRMVAVKHFQLQNADPSIPVAQMISEFLTQYYVGQNQEMQEPGAGDVPGTTPETDINHQNFGEGVPNEILVPELPSDHEILEKALGLTFVVADGAVDKQLLNVAKNNAQYALEQQKRRGGGHGLAALEEVQEKLQLPNLPSRIECYDISNIQSSDAVASRVVFIDGAPDKNLYRRYKIKSVEGQNDFAMMREVLGRRFGENGSASAQGEEMPDLVVVDGGKGQLAQAVAIFEELNVQGVEVVGLAKARTESDFQKTEVESTMERIFIPGRKNPINLYPTSAACKLLAHVRDEAHRFAVSYHRVVRSKRTIGRSPSKGRAGGRTSRRRTPPR